MVYLVTFLLKSPITDISHRKDKLTNGRTVNNT